jgi:mannose/fructose-specific phosphotransferase system component IIA
MAPVYGSIEDLVGGTPFIVASERCIAKENFCCVGGLNTMAFLSLQYELEAGVSEVADLAVNYAKEAVMRFPPVEE